MVWEAYVHARTNWQASLQCWVEMQFAYDTTAASQDVHNQLLWGNCKKRLTVLLAALQGRQGRCVMAQNQGQLQPVCQQLVSTCRNAMGIWYVIVSQDRVQNADVWVTVMCARTQRCLLCRFEHRQQIWAAARCPRRLWAARGHTTMR